MSPLEEFLTTVKTLVTRINNEAASGLLSHETIILANEVNTTIEAIELEWKSLHSPPAQHGH